MPMTPEKWEQIPPVDKKGVKEHWQDPFDAAMKEIVKAASRRGIEITIEDNIDEKKLEKLKRKVQSAKGRRQLARKIKAFEEEINHDIGV